MTIFKVSQVAEKLGYKSKAAIYLCVAAGTLTKQISTGLRATGWPSAEIESIVEAREAGMDQSNIKRLVEALHRERAERLEAMTLRRGL